MLLPTISPADAKRLLDLGAVLVDIREADEHAREKIPGARHLPLSRLDATDLVLPQGKPVLFHCRSGARTLANAGRLAAKAATCDAYIVEGGLDAWKKAGLAIRNVESRLNIKRISLRPSPGGQRVTGPAPRRAGDGPVGARCRRTSHWRWPGRQPRRESPRATHPAQRRLPTWQREPRHRGRLATSPHRGRGRRPVPPGLAAVEARGTLRPCLGHRVPSLTHSTGVHGIRTRT